MKTSTFQKGSRLVAAGAMALAIADAASTAHAAASHGGVTITGTRYIDGVPYKVRCTAAEGNEILMAGAHQLDIVPGPECGIYYDTDDTDRLIFDGRSDYVLKNGAVATTYVFSGVQVLAGPSGTDMAKGAMHGMIKLSNGKEVSEKGAITYSRINAANQSVIFIGKFKTGRLSEL